MDGERDNPGTPQIRILILGGPARRGARAGAGLRDKLPRLATPEPDPSNRLRASFGSGHASFESGAAAGGFQRVAAPFAISQPISRSFQTSHTARAESTRDKLSTSYPSHIHLPFCAPFDACPDLWPL